VAPLLRSSFTVELVSLTYGTFASTVTAITCLTAGTIRGKRLARNRNAGGYGRKNYWKTETSFANPGNYHEMPVMFSPKVLCNADCYTRPNVVVLIALDLSLTTGGSDEAFRGGSSATGWRP